MARTICLLTLPLLLFASEEFIFWAKFLAQNQLLKSQNIAISRALTISTGSGEQLCEIRSAPLSGENSLKYLKRHENELLDCFMSSEIHLLDSGLASTNSVATTTNLTVAPIRFKLNFDNNSAIISKIKADK